MLGQRITARNLTLVAGLLLVVYLVLLLSINVRRNR